ncbi:hypothetical protein AY601_1769 [Pedobacter cryoconitis]|uniref:Uncharacterized protein n=1 Tax=Pedobacter cryoconitis TaxID=188932 RepID=A0A127VBB1_9SPHI|nr:hypothetical protein [Pedobacter cryoconitis]AMP98682.1 hypothetical protein AY601_1769 [Pedobacter cryoconitis]
MKQGMILFERLPIARIGVENTTERVVIANDYSCLGYMLEEYISYGVVKIVMPKSAAEVNFLDRMPLLLQKRIVVIDDQNEIENVNRILYHLRNDFRVTYDDQNEELKFLNGTPKALITAIKHVHSELKKLAFGFNHGVQVNLNLPLFKKKLQSLKKIAKDSNTRIVLSEIEGVLNQYVDLQVTGLQSPKQQTPHEMVALFDNLLNDKSYLEFSSQIADLILPENREGALVKLRQIGRFIKDKKYLSEGWDYVTKILKVFNIVELPESKVISSLFSDRNFPIIHDMTVARQNAINNWKVNANTSVPLAIDGLQIGDNITWLPPLPSLKVEADFNYLSLGTLKELKNALEVISLSGNSDEP